MPFPLLSDTDREIVTAWRLLNTHEHGGIAFPAMFVLDAARRVGFRSLDRTVYRVDFAAVMDFIEKRAPATEAAPHRCGVIPAFRDFAGATRSAIRLGIRVPVRRG